MAVGAFLCMMSTSCVYHVTSTINRLIIKICAFNLLVSLMEAHFWHLTEPTTMGIKMWPILVIVTTFCGPAITIILLSHLKALPPFGVRLLISLLCPISLLVGSLPESASARTAIIATGMFLTPFVMFIHRPRCRPGVTGEAFLAVFITMCVRLTANSVNVFYESAVVPSVFLSVFVVSSIINYDAHRKMGETDDDVTLERTLNDGDSMERAHSILLLFFLAPGLSSSLMLLVQYFTSPVLLIRWSGYAAGPLRFVVLAICCVNAVICARGFNQAPVVRWMKNMSNREHMALVACSSVVLLIGSTLFIFAVKGPALNGVILICLVLPPIITRLIDLFLLVQTHVSWEDSYYLGLSLVESGCVYFYLHIMILSFNVPTLMSTVIGRMDIILLTQVSLVLVAWVGAELYLIYHNKALTRPYNVTYSEQIFKLQWITRCAFLLVVVVVTGVVTGTTSTILSCDHLDGIKSNTYYDDVAQHGGGSDRIRVMSWNVLLGHSMSGRDNSACVSRAVQYFGPDIIAFQESDPLPTFWGGKDFLGSCQHQLAGFGYKTLQGVHPMKSTLGVGLMSKLELIDHKASLLPVEIPNLVPHYTYLKSSFKVPNSDRPLHVISVHAVFKNWTVGNLTNLAASHLKLLAKEANSIPNSDPVLVIGDLNMDPIEAQLDSLWIDAKLKCAIHPVRTGVHGTSTLDQYAAIDHIFYRNLKLLSPGMILSKVGPLSDHFPVMADFEFPP